MLSTVAIGEAVASDFFLVEVKNDAPATSPLGPTVVTWTATDSRGNSTSVTQSVELVDATKPELTVPADVMVTATGEQTVVDIGTATAEDVFPVTVTSNAQASYPPGTTVVTWRARTKTATGRRASNGSRCAT